LWHEPDTRRKFFENYAKQKGFNPLIPENWYNQAHIRLLGQQARRVIPFHRYSVGQALVELFPEIGLQKSLFTSQHRWNVSVERRNFFESYAKQNRFDPLIPENWYNVSTKKLLAKKGGMTILGYYSNSIPKALQNLFPEMLFDKTKYCSSKLAALWRVPANRRQFFEEYAKRKGFDPFNTANWHTQSHKQVLMAKGALEVVEYHGGSVSQALLDLFPSGSR